MRSFPAHVEALVALAEDAEGERVGVEQQQEVERRLLGGLEAVFGGVGDVEELAEPGLGAGAVEPLGEGHAVETLAAVGLAVRDPFPLERGAVPDHAARHGHEGPHDLGLGEAAAVEEGDVEVEGEVVEGEVVERDRELLGEPADVDVAGIDQLAPQLGDLTLGKKPRWLYMRPPARSCPSKTRTDIPRWCSR